MTNIVFHAPEQRSVVSDAIVGTLTAAMFALAGLLVLSQLAVAFA